MSDKKKILVIDDQIGDPDSPSRDAFLDNCEELEYQFVLTTSMDESGEYTADAGVEAVREHLDVSLVLLDIKFGSESDRLGVDILRGIRSNYPNVPVVMMTSLDSEPSTVVGCIRQGAKDYITKGLGPRDLHDVIERYALDVTASHLILGSSKKFAELRRDIEKVADNATVSVLILGERGTGKELVARSIHRLGPRHQGPFVAVNCAGLPRDLFAAELFGAEKGAYTGAHQRKYGYLELANGGVLFLDEIADMPMELQASLLRVIETRAFRRVGVSQDEIPVDFQLICATNADLATLVRNGTFRADLYDRIGTFKMHTPSLRECPEEIEPLAMHWLALAKESMGGASYHTSNFSAKAMEVLKAHSWPGNVRELRNIVESAMIRSERGTIEVDDLPLEITASSSGPMNHTPLKTEGEDLNRKLAEIELSYLAAAYEAAGRNKAETMRRFFPQQPLNYFDRFVFDAAKRAPEALEQFPVLRKMHDNERRRRSSA